MGVKRKRRKINFDSAWSWIGEEENNQLCYIRSVAEYLLLFVGYISIVATDIDNNRISYIIT